MRHLARAFGLAFLFLLAAFAQTDRYVIPLDINVSGERTITIAQPATGGKRWELEEISMQIIGTGLALKLERDCSTVNTDTPIVPTSLNPETTSTAGPAVRVYDLSAASGCTRLSPAWEIPANGFTPVPMLGVFKQGLGTSKNINIRLSVSPLYGVLSGTLHAQIVLREAR